jgi:hypothetical protein
MIAAWKHLRYDGWLGTTEKEFCQPGIEMSFHSMTYASLVEGSLWKNRASISKKSELFLLQLKIKDSRHVHSKAIF